MSSSHRIRWVSLTILRFSLEHIRFARSPLDANICTIRSEYQTIGGSSSVWSYLARCSCRTSRQFLCLQWTHIFISPVAYHFYFYNCDFIWRSVRSLIAFVEVCFDVAAVFVRSHDDMRINFQRSYQYDIKVVQLLESYLCDTIGLSIVWILVLSADTLILVLTAIRLRQLGVHFLKTRLTPIGSVMLRDGQFSISMWTQQRAKINPLYSGVLYYS